MCLFKCVLQQRRGSSSVVSTGYLLFAGVIHGLTEGLLAKCKLCFREDMQTTVTPVEAVFRWLLSSVAGAMSSWRVILACATLSRTLTDARTSTACNDVEVRFERFRRLVWS